MRKLAEPFEIQDYQLIPDTDLYTKTVRNAKHLLGTAADSLLYTFRVNAGLDTRSAKPLGGWESPDMWFRGMYVGHYLTACEKAAVTLSETDPELSEALRHRAEEIVEGLKECQDALTKTEAYPGYLAAVESSFLDNQEQLNFTGTYTVIYYNLHKIMCGLLDVWHFAGSQTALNMVKKMADYIHWRMKKLSPERIDAMLNTIWYREDTSTYHMEFGGMAEVLYRLYKITGKTEHLWLAKCFDRRWFRDMLLGEKDLLGHYSLHANTEIPCVTGLAEAADILDDEEAKICVDHFMALLEHGHLLPHGGVSGRSAYTSPADYGGELFEFPYMYFKHTNAGSGESCCSHNLNVLSRKEFAWTADCHWAEEHEKRYVNTILAQQHPVTGGFVYNLTLRQGSLKGHSADGFFCCCGTGVEYYAALADGSFYHKGNTLWLANYVPCNLNWKDQGVQVECRTRFPQNGHVTWTFHMEEKKELKIQVRTPLWAKKIADSLKDYGEWRSSPMSSGIFYRNQQNLEGWRHHRSRISICFI